MYRIAVIFVLTLGFHLPARADTEPVTQPTEILKAWIPIGFDNNDHTQVLIDGAMPSSCYRVAGYTKKVDPVAKTISLQQNVTSYPGTCLEMVVPFTETIELGTLDPAEYTLLDQTSGRVLGTLPVARATSRNIDDYLYANVRSAWTTKDAATGRTTVHCSYDLPSKCTRFQKADVHYYPDVIVIQPILERIDNKACGKTLERTEFKVELKAGLQGTRLLHVRAMSGKAINKLIDIE